MRQYKRMTYQIRMQIETLYNLSGLCATEIARLLGYHHTSMLAELKRGFYMHRNGDWTETKRYSADIAQRKADFEKSAKGATMKIGADYEFVRIIEDLILRRHLSPAAALATIRREKIQTKTKVCVTTLYHYIDKGVFLHVTNKDLVCRGERKRKYRRVKKAKTPPRGRSIDIRPPHILARDEFGHWELDSVIGTNEKGNTLLVMTERKTRFQLIFRSKDKTAASTIVMLDRLEKRLGVGKFRKIFRTITCDNGCEFSDWRRMELSRRGNSIRTTVFFCHPFCSSERGTNENQNRIIRRFIRKGVPIGHYTDTDISNACEYLNDLPRQIFGWETARERFKKELLAIGLKFF